MDYELRRSDRRTVGLEVRGGRLIVRAPRDIPRAELERLLAGHAAWIERALAREAARRAAHPEPDEAARAALLERARAVLPGRVAHYAAVMGLYPAGITITGARTRFGSCSAKGRLCFSWRLMQYPPEAVDYVVVHELAHLVHRNHGRAFYALVERILPDYRERQRLLRE